MLSPRTRRRPRTTAPLAALPVTIAATFVATLALAPFATVFVGCTPPAAQPAAGGAHPTDGGAPSAAAPAASPAPSAPPATSEPASALPLPPPPPNAGSTKVTRKRDPAWASCRRGYEAKRKDVAADVAAMAQACAKVTQLKRIGKPLTGAQSDQDPPQSFALQAQANHCYRVYAQGSEGIRDLDVAINDSTGALAGEDATDDASPVVFDDGAVCFKVNDAATVIVSVGLGKGNYAAEIWSD